MLLSMVMLAIDPQTHGTKIFQPKRRPS